MLESLVLKHFQRHKHFCLKLDPHITVLTGPTNSGKSSVLRALTWLFTNRPLGNTFINWEAESCLVSVTLDGHDITRSTGVTGNHYALDGKVYLAFNKDVPEDIANLLNVGEANFSPQLSAPWWFLDSPGEVSKNLNSIVNLELIDRTLSSLSTEVKRSKTVVEITSERLDKALKVRDSLSWVPDADASLKELESFNQELEECKTQNDDLESLLSQLDKIDSLREDSKDLIYATEMVVGSGESLLGARDRLDALEALISEIGACQTRVESLTLKLAKVESEIEEGTQGVCPACQQPLTQITPAP